MRNVDTEEEMCSVCRAKVSMTNVSGVLYVNNIPVCQIRILRQDHNKTDPLLKQRHMVIKAAVEVIFKVIN